MGVLDRIRGTLGSLETQDVIAIITTIAVLLMAGFQVPAPDHVSTGWLALVGFYYGQKTVQRAQKK